jgi:hypothetical protein
MVPLLARSVRPNRETWVNEAQAAVCPSRGAFLALAAAADRRTEEKPMTHFKQILTRTAPALAMMAGAASAPAQQVEPAYQAHYSLANLGAVPGAPTPYGAVGFLPGHPDTLLIGGQANTSPAAIYRVNIARDAQGDILGFAGPATVFASAPSLDGGLDFGPMGTLFYTTYPGNQIGQIAAGHIAPDRLTLLTPLGVPMSTGSLVVVPPGFPGAGLLKILSYTGRTWHSATLVHDGGGLFSITGVSEGVNTGTRSEGAVYIPTNNPLFGTASVLISDYEGGRVVRFHVDANGDRCRARRATSSPGLPVRRGLCWTRSRASSCSRRSGAGAGCWRCGASCRRRRATPTATARRCRPC